MEVFNGKYVIVRCRDAGVHAGILVKHAGRECYLENSRRLSRFKTVKGDSLTAVALYGIDTVWTESRIEGETNIIVLDACEIIPASTEAEATIRNAPEFMP